MVQNKNKKNINASVIILKNKVGANKKYKYFWIKFLMMIRM